MMPMAGFTILVGDLDLQVTCTIDMRYLHKISNGEICIITADIDGSSRLNYHYELEEYTHQKCAGSTVA